MDRVEGFFRRSGPSFSAGEARWSRRESDQGDCRFSVRWVLRLTKDLVVALLGHEASSFEPNGVADLLSVHGADTGILHTLSSLASEKSVQHKLFLNVTKLCSSA